MCVKKETEPYSTVKFFTFVAPNRSWYNVVMSSAAPRATLVATDTEHLKLLVGWEITANGPACDLNHIDVSNITDMTQLFSNSPFVGDISGWNVSKVTRANSMFFSSPFNGDISLWNTKNLQLTIGMFRLSQFNGDLSAWDTSSVYNARAMFGTAAFEGDISKWNVDKLENCEQMFVGSKCKSDLSAWVLKKDCKYTWMMTERFQGILPRVAGGAESMKYGRMFAEHSALRKYLAETPFSHVHATLLMGLKGKPDWASSEMFKTVKSVQSMAKTVGLKHAATHQLIMDSVSPAATHESFPVDDLIPL